MRGAGGQSVLHLELLQRELAGDGQGAGAVAGEPGQVHAGELIRAVQAEGVGSRAAGDHAGGFIVAQRQVQRAVPEGERGGIDAVFKLLEGNADRFATLATGYGHSKTPDNNLGIMGSRGYFEGDFETGKSEMGFC